MKYFLLVSFIVITSSTLAQKNVWKEKKCAVVLTYDDAIDVDIDNVLPALDSFNLKGTFYLIGASPVVNKRVTEWRKASLNGHELGNHGMFHPCDGSKPGRGFVTPDNDLSKYSLTRIINETRINNTLLKAIDGKDSRTFAYPCGDLKIGDTLFYPPLQNDFVGARGVNGRLQSIDTVHLDNIDAFSISARPASYMIDLVKKAMETNTLLVFLFHGVGGGHNINEERSEHSKLLAFLNEHKKDIWVAPMVEVANYVRKHQAAK